MLFQSSPPAAERDNAATPTGPAMVKERIDLPGFAGLRVPAARATTLRELAAAIADAGPPEAPILFVSQRNDITVFAASTPFWLTSRRPATRYHEIHPGITDVEWRQREMITALEAGPLPVVVREHRFPNAYLDPVKAAMQQHVPVGATTIDTWIAERYQSGRRFDNYEVMQATAGRAPRVTFDRVPSGQPRRLVQAPRSPAHR